MELIRNKINVRKRQWVDVALMTIFIDNIPLVQILGSHGTKAFVLDGLKSGYRSLCSLMMCLFHVGNFSTVHYFAVIYA